MGLRMKWLVRGLTALIFCGIVAVGGAAAVFWYFGQDLPDYAQLHDYQPPMVTRVHAGDGRLMAEYAIERRIFVPIGAIPKTVIDAFLSAEDKNFYEHPGIDINGLGRAVVNNLSNLGSNRRQAGGSTITQQVAKNFLLGNEVSLRRKVREAILAFRLEQALTKDRILELYLNEIYLGFGSYGVATAALNYFNRSLNELTVAEAAYLAVLPKAPNNYNPNQFPERAKARRDWVIERMQEDGVISAADAATAKALPITIRKRDAEETVRADYFAEEVRKELAARFGDAGLYKGGLSVRTTLDPKLQTIADKVLKDGMIAYDRRHGWRGLPLAKGLPVTGDWQRGLTALTPPPVVPGWEPALVLKLENDGAEIGLRNGQKGRIPMSELTWARATQPEQKLGPAVRRPSDVFAAGDVVLVEPVTLAPDGRTRHPANSYGLRQIPDVGGGLIALDPHTGRVLAMTGGWSYEISQFNRAIQAQRQPGSSFKPFVYMAALDNGFTPSTLVLDAPFVIDQGAGLGKWKPLNYTERFYGPIPLRTALEQSLNLVTVRVADMVGMDRVAEYAQRFGVVDRLPRFLSMSIGAGETTLLRLTTAYAMIVNGGRQISPSLIDRIQDRDGKTIFRHDRRLCDACMLSDWAGSAPPEQRDERAQVVEPSTAYQMVSMLQGAVERGTGTVIKAVGKPLAGKTGTTNDYTDAWFVGFSPDLVVGVFLGFDTPRTLGTRETGGGSAAPIFRDFMMAALADKPGIPFRIPPGVRLVRVNAETGAMAGAGDTKVLFEAFKPGTEPRPDRPNGAIPAGMTATPASTGAQSPVGETVPGLY